MTMITSVHRWQHLLFLAGGVFFLFAVGHYLYTHKDGIVPPEQWQGGDTSYTYTKAPGSPSVEFSDAEQQPEDEADRVKFDPTKWPGYDLVEDPEFNPSEELPTPPSDLLEKPHTYDQGESKDSDITEIDPLEVGPVKAAPLPEEIANNPDFAPANTHRIVYSRTTVDRKYFRINSRDHRIYNANILPHPQHNTSWIVIGQKRIETATYHFSELYCEAVFLNGELYCVKNPLTLTIGSAPSFNCNGSMAMMGFSVGARDARAFYSPEIPILTFGAKSQYTCLGQYAADLRSLMDWEFEFFDPDKFRAQTELQRPPPIGLEEKNWFLWWNTEGDMYAHYDLEPRSFAKIEYDGSAGPNLATKVPSAASRDQTCIDKFLPRTSMNENESVHQSTNSLAITFCRRSDPTCVPSPANTYIMAIVQHKICPGIHSVYEPYVILFQQDAPFSLLGISTKPLWIYGRLLPGEHDGVYAEKVRPHDESEMMYVTSMSWKTHGQKFHGYLDDELFLSFGIEDTHAGGIDVVASDILQDIGFCENVKRIYA